MPSDRPSKIAVAGKGGTGKTTVAGTLARAIAARGHRVWAIDADSNPNLALTVGLPREAAGDLRTLPRDLLEETTTGEGERAVRLSMPPAEVAGAYGVDAPDGITLMLMGTVRHAGAG